MRKLLLPFSLIYGAITVIRNALFDAQILKSVEPNIKTIGVGNLRVGGTGKTPMVEYLLEHVSNNMEVAVLSRGYGRKTAGHILADSSSTASEIGDEPAQIKRKFPNVTVAVDGDRVHGISKLEQLKPKPELVILDDVYQHRYIKPGLLILLTRYGDLYCDDLLLPAGMLRESKSGADRADVIVVTKCPASLSLDQRREIRSSLKPKQHQQVLFSTVGYGDVRNSNGEQPEHTAQEVILVSGIADPSDFITKAEASFDVVQKLLYKDHHLFTENDIQSMVAVMKQHPNANLLTTEKDWQRLKLRIQNSNLDEKRILIQPITTEFLDHDQETINTIVDDYLK